MAADPLRQTFYSFNSKTGFVQRHNMELQVTVQRQVWKEEITAYCWAGHRLESLVLGFADGLVKVFRVSVDDKDV